MAVAVEEAKEYDRGMSYIQADLFAQDSAERNRISEDMLVATRARLEATLARLEAAETFPWSDPLDAVHEENRFQRGTDMLGDEGAALWARFDKEMDRLYATQH
mgnify:FL=1|jgi:hypothetical protein